jgi:hypothetical protein
LGKAVILHYGYSQMEAKEEAAVRKLIKDAA